MTRSTDDIRRELKEAEAREREAAEQRRRDTPIVWRYTLLPQETDRWQDLFDEHSALYRLVGEVVNREEVTAVGHPDYELRGGGMTYVFNKLSGRLVTPVGGGTIFVTGERAHETMAKLSEFLVEHPEGGDVTSVVEEGRKS